MNIRWVVLFAVVAEEGSFTRAATRINVAQPWLSAQIKKLEHEIGVKLLERLTSGVELTAEGRSLFVHAKTIAEATTRFRDLARTMGDTLSKIVRIGSHLPMFDIPALRRLNDEFGRKFQNFSLRADTGAKEELLASLDSGSLDFVVVASPVANGDDKLEITPIEPIKPYLLLLKTAPLANGGTYQGQVIAVPARAGFSDPLLDSLKAAGASFRPVPEVDRRAMEHFARTHKLPVVMLDGDAQDFAGDPELTTIPLADFHAEHVLVRVRGRELGRAAERYWTLATAGKGKA